MKYLCILTKVVILPIMIFTLLIQSANAASVTLKWDASADSDQVTGYKIYYGTSSGNYSNNVDVGNVTQHTIEGLDSDTTYYFAATAYDIDGLESYYSNEVILSGLSDDDGGGGGAGAAGGDDGGGGACFIATAALGTPILYKYSKSEKIDFLSVKKKQMLTKGISQIWE